MVHTFAELREYLNDIPHINFGGCGISALTMYRWMKINKPHVTDISVVYAYDCDNDVHANDEAIENNSPESMQACSHAYLRVNKILFDSCKAYPIEIVPSRFRLDFKYFDDKYLTGSLNNVTSWNWKFDRQFVRQIMEETCVDLSDIKID